MLTPNQSPVANFEVYAYNAPKGAHITLMELNWTSG